MPSITTHITITDAVLWQSQKLLTAAGTDVHQQATAKQAILKLLASIPNQFVQDNYTDLICKTHKWKATDTKKQLAQIIETLPSAQQPITNEDGDYEIPDDSKRPKWISTADLKQYHEKGYFIADNKAINKVGYYSLSISQSENGSTYNAVTITNFIITPLFHIYAGPQSRFLIKIYNGYTKSSLDIQAGKITSIDQFQALSVAEGNFVIFGNKSQWLRIASDLLSKFPKCKELEDLGWIQDGFFAYSDYIYAPQLGNIPVDNYGIFEYNQNKYLLPQQCEVYRELQKTSSDPFEQDRYLIYRPSPISFTGWAQKMHQVFGVKSAISIAWLIFCMFRDIVMKTTSTSPHLYLYGPTGSGKSACANAINSLFYVGRKPFIAYEGTTFAFNAYLSRFCNAPAYVNELDAATTDPDRMQTIKGVFDGESRERGKKEGGKRSTETQQVNCGLLLCGQYLITADDNAIVNRSIVEDFLPKDDRTQAEIQAFNDLDEINKQGITSLLTELLNMRPNFTANFRTQYLQLLGTWVKKSADDGKPLMQRIMQNYAVMATCYSMLSQNYTALPVSAPELTNYCLAQARKWSNFVSSSDTLSDFWKFVSYLFDIGQVIDGWDIIVEETFAIELRDGEIKRWDAGLKLLYLRLNNVHKIYQKEYRTRYSKEAMTEANLLHYFSSKKYYIGPVKQKQFKRYKNQGAENNEGKPFTELQTQKQITSCYAFNYTDIAAQVDGFNLLREEIIDQFTKPPDAGKNWQPVPTAGNLFEKT